MRKTLLLLFMLLISTGFSFAQTTEELSFDKEGKVELSQFDSYPDDAIVTINISVTNADDWGPGYVVGRIVDYAFAKDFDDSGFGATLTVKEASEEGALNSYQFTVAELKALASITPDELEELIATSEKEFGVDWTVDENNYIVDADGNSGIAVNVWGTGTLISITIQNAPPTFVLDFESDEIGQEYPTISINDDITPEDITAVVEERPGGEGNALHVINGRWNTYPQFSVTLPEGKTLADVEKISFELYFASNEAVDGQQQNSYKDFRYFFGPEGTTFTEAGTTISQLVGNPSDNPVFTWLKKDFVPVIDDEDLLSLNQFDFGLGLHINAAGNYFLDNITFVLKEAEGGGGETEGSAVFDFESDDIDTEYPMMHAWGSPDESSATVVANPLEASENSLKVLPANYDGVVYFPVTLPTGFTVADITGIQFDSYFGSIDEQYAPIELFIAPKEATIGSGTHFDTYPVYLKTSDGGEGKPEALQVSSPDEWFVISITRDEICDENFNFGTKYDFNEVDDLSEFWLGVGISVQGGTEYFMDNIMLILGDNLTGKIAITPSIISKAYGTEGGIVVATNNEKVSIYGIDGRLVKQTVANPNSFIPLLRGIYIVKVGEDKPAKVVVK